ncbi:hypothetical protein HQ545_05170 [Candidatus Woesearchaeota archaeon]|nr:hypothetical protein [Candidatus Woesearchaeota archaeon]
MTVRPRRNNVRKNKGLVVVRCNDHRKKKKPDEESKRNRLFRGAKVFLGVLFGILIGLGIGYWLNDLSIGVVIGAGFGFAIGNWFEFASRPSAGKLHPVTRNLLIGLVTLIGVMVITFLVILNILFG